MNKPKLINDPVHGLIEIPGGLLFELIEQPEFQRLRRISQLGLTSLVYPGAIHTRFHHAIGAMHLMQKALLTLRSKKVEISDHELESACVAILLHDLGHGPFSHALEMTLSGIAHEAISVKFMHLLNIRFNGALNDAIAMFLNSYPRHFFHKLISGQIDTDRLDYLRRDSFFTGVSEGTIGIDRILQMLHVHNDCLCVEEKALISIEKFIIARRLMYWQVYYHKTVMAAEELLIRILRRARQLVSEGMKLFATTSFACFLNKQSTDILDEPLLFQFSKLDDFDVLASIKEWEQSNDKELSSLCSALAHRKLPKILLLGNIAEGDGFDSSTNLWDGNPSVSISSYDFDDEILVFSKQKTLVKFSEMATQYGLQPPPSKVIRYYRIDWLL